MEPLSAFEAEPGFVEQPAVRVAAVPSTTRMRARKRRVDM
jgi:hypothetical protein